MPQSDSDHPAATSRYHPKLLEPGWAGDLSRDEYRWVKSQISKSRSLKRRWGMRPSAKRLSEKHLRQVARDGLFRRS